MHSVAVIGDIRIHNLNVKGNYHHLAGFSKQIYGGACLMQKVVQTAIDRFPLWHDAPKVFGMQPPSKLNKTESMPVGSEVAWDFRCSLLTGQREERYRFFEREDEECAWEWPGVDDAFRKALLEGGFEDEKINSPGAGTHESPDILLVDDLGLILRSTLIQEFEFVGLSPEAHDNSEIKKTKSKLQIDCEKSLSNPDKDSSRQGIYAAALSMLLARLRFAAVKAGPDLLEPLIVGGIDHNFYFNDGAVTPDGNNKCSHEQLNFWSAVRNDPQLRRRTVLLLDADVLRNKPLFISSGYSWERTAQDTVASLLRDPAMKEWLKLGHVIVRYGVSGALHIEARRNGQLQYTLYFDPRIDDGTWTDKDRDGTVLGASSVLAATIVEYLTYHCNHRGANHILTLGSLGRVIGTALEHAIPRCQRLVCRGYGRKRKRWNQVDNSNGAPNHFDPVDQSLFSVLSDDADVGLAIPSAVWIPSAVVQESPSDDWSIMGQLPNTDFDQLAEGIVRNGAAEMLNRPRMNTTIMIELMLHQSFKQISDWCVVQGAREEAENRPVAFIKWFLEKPVAQTFFSLPLIERTLGKDVRDQLCDKLLGFCNDHAKLAKCLQVNSDQLGKAIDTIIRTGRFTLDLDCRSLLEWIHCERPSTWKVDDVLKNQDSRYALKAFCKFIIRTTNSCEIPDLHENLKPFNSIAEKATSFLEEIELANSETLIKNELEQLQKKLEDQDKELKKASEDLESFKSNPFFVGNLPDFECCELRLESHRREIRATNDRLGYLESELKKATELKARIDSNTQSLEKVLELFADEKTVKAITNGINAVLQALAADKRLSEKQQSDAWKAIRRIIEWFFEEHCLFHQAHQRMQGALSAPILRLGEYEFGKVDKRMVVVDRREIEGIRTIKRLIDDHLSQVTAGTVERPLSIAVFGPPGAGKSTAVKRLLAEAEKGKKYKTKELQINLSQIHSIDDLNGKFKLISDSILAKNLPIVFFDEFDAKMGSEELGWIKSFLAPMEDGVYRGATIKNAIFVFAGGTSSSFSQFSRDGAPNDEGMLAYVNAKGPDFVSRLGGSLDVVGVNSVGPQDELHLIRRAILIRDILRNLQNLGESGDSVKIDDSMLYAMLHVPKFKYGGRSVRMLLQMCTASNGRVTMSAIPPIHQLNMQVDGNVFLKLIRRASLGFVDKNSLDSQFG